MRLINIYYHERAGYGNPHWDHQIGMGERRFPYFMRDVSWGQPLCANDEIAVWDGVQDLHSTLYAFQVESGK